MNETQIKNAARRIARKAVRLQAQGKYEEARAMRARGEVVH
jgi:hypothetical protein